MCSEFKPVNHIIVSSKKWGEQVFERLSNVDCSFFLINNKNDLNLGYLKEISPEYIFFLHWSYIIPEEIYKNYKCIVFHMTDLPFGRGGSPLQNLIIRGIKDTKISAIDCVKELDAGDVYIKRQLSLAGTAQEIFERAGYVVQEMIEYIIANHPTPVAQKGEVVYFKRRVPEQSNLESAKNLQEVYDHIRMLDCPEYPKAFIKTEQFVIEFQNAVLDDQQLKAEVVIKKRDE